MFAVRFIILLFLAAYGWGMGQTPPSGLNDFGKFISATFFFTAPALYMLPTYEAWNNRHPNLGAIALVNIFLGWTAIGWVVAIVWAFKKAEPVTVRQVPIESSAEPWRAFDRPATSSGPSTPTTKKCPYCAEDIKVEAIKCKHCGSDLTATKA